MAVRVQFVGESFKAQNIKRMDESLSAMAIAQTSAAREASELILNRGRADIKQAGKFGTRWTEGLQSIVQPKTGALINARITITHNVDYFDIFQTGGTIRGKPFLWIPLSYTGIILRASEYARLFGGLFFVQRASGRPLLLSIRDKQPKFFGITSVHIRKRFHTIEIITEVMKGFDRLYTKHLKV